ncbi:hypothetical protein TSUD_344900 [Trifolium subterraneum]|nr:hypothetical protein TSUD_344900 [Trifolium subterraneum]
METLNSYQISNDQDLWVWKHDATRIFSVKSAYSVLVSNLGVTVVSPEVSDQVLAKVWKSWVPSKVIVFSWQLLQDRIPSRQNLFRRNVITDPHNILCILCGMSIESVDHLFLICDLSSSAWYSIFRWLGIQAVLPRGVIWFFDFFLDIGVGRRGHIGWLLIWHAVIWFIWISWNGLIFSGGTSSVDYLVDRVKLFSWSWYLTKHPGNLCSYYKWEVQPIL